MIANNKDVRFIVSEIKIVAKLNKSEPRKNHGSRSNYP